VNSDQRAVFITEGSPFTGCWLVWVSTGYSVQFLSGKVFNCLAYCQYSDFAAKTTTTFTDCAFISTMMIVRWTKRWCTWLKMSNVCIIRVFFTAAYNYQHHWPAAAMALALRISHVSLKHAYSDSPQVLSKGGKTRSKNRDMAYA
jgi:hypothetical protein